MDRKKQPYSNLEIHTRLLGIALENFSNSFRELAAVSELSTEALHELDFASKVLRINDKIKELKAYLKREVALHAKRTAEFQEGDEVWISNKYYPHFNSARAKVVRVEWALDKSTGDLSFNYITETVEGLVRGTKGLSWMKLTLIER